MENSLTAALARQSVLARQMDVIATNLANMTTAGFKAETMIFTEVVKPAGPDGDLSLVHDVSFVRDLAEGPMQETGNPLDLGLRGDGYFLVETADGPRGQRHGALQIDAEGRIVTLEGNPVLGAGNAPILVPPETGSIVVTRDGTVSADAQQIGQIQIVRFDNAQALKKLANGLYEAEDQAPQPATEFEIQQGMVEGSNVKGVVEMTRMIDVVRNYQMAARLADTEHQRILDAIEGIVGTA